MLFLLIRSIYKIIRRQELIGRGARTIDKFLNCPDVGRLKEDVLKRINEIENGGRDIYY